MSDTIEIPKAWLERLVMLNRLVRIQPGENWAVYLEGYIESSEELLKKKKCK